jgi:chemotaxis protein methyltransferase CheR
VEILATDLDSNVLRSAQQGVYAEERLDNLDSRWKRLGFLRGKGANAGKVKVRPEAGALVRFALHNLLGDDWPEPGTMDAVFCRNVMIYFDKPTQKHIVGRFRDCLAPGGLLAVGHSESLLNAASGFENMGRTLYRRMEGAP